MYVYKKVMIDAKTALFQRQDTFEKDWKKEYDHFFMFRNHDFTGILSTLDMFYEIL